MKNLDILLIILSGILSVLYGYVCVNYFALGSNGRGFVYLFCAVCWALCFAMRTYSLIAFKKK